MSTSFCTSWQLTCRGFMNGSLPRYGLHNRSLIQSPIHSLSVVIRHRVISHIHRNSKATPAWASRPLLAQQWRSSFHNSWISTQQAASDAGSVSIPAQRASKGIKTGFALPAKRVNSIFHGAVSTKDGNLLLAKLQNQRQDGTLDVELDATKEAVDAGLKYLRTRYPLDEDAAVIARIDRELENELRLPQEKAELSPHAESQLANIRKENKARHEREAFIQLQQLKRSEELDETRRELVETTSTHAVSNQQAKENLALQAQEGVIRKEPEWVTYYRRKAEGTDMPSISSFKRLFPTGIFTLVVVALSYLFAQNYTAPEKDARLFPNLPPAAATMYGVLAINFLVYAAWKTPQLWVALTRYFIVVPLRPKAPSLLLAAFSHQDFPHLLQNCVFLWFVGVRLHDNIGRGPLLGLVCASAVLGAYATMSTFIISNMLFTSTLGASNIVCAMIAAQCILHEGSSVQFPFLFDEWAAHMNTGLVLALLIGFQAFGIWRVGLINPKAVELQGFAVDKVGHLTGYVVGTIVGWLYRQHHPEWRDLERHSFWYWWDFEKGHSKRLKQEVLKPDTSST